MLCQVLLWQFKIRFKITFFDRLADLKMCEYSNPQAYFLLIIKVLNEFKELRLLNED